MKKITQLMTVSTLLAAGSMASAGSTCMGETYSGKVVTLRMNTMGTFGAFASAELTVTDKDGKILLNHKNEERSAQFAETMRGNKAVVIYSDIGSDFDVILNYLGTDFSELQWNKDLELEQILKDSRRKKEPGNSLVIYSYTPGLKNIELTDVVCSLDHDV